MKLKCQRGFSAIFALETAAMLEFGACLPGNSGMARRYA